MFDGFNPLARRRLYEDRVGDNHHHVICRQCGKTVDVDCTVGDTPCLNAADNSGYEIEEAEVIFGAVVPNANRQELTTELNGYVFENLASAWTCF
ncbi:MAG: transcriptional repressor [Pirellulaceae bacterium]